MHYFLQPLLIWLQKVDPKYKYLHRRRSLDWHIFWHVYDYFPPLSWSAHLCIVPFSKAHSALSRREKLSSLCISFKKCIDGEREIKVEWMFILFTPYRDAMQNGVKSFLNSHLNSSFYSYTCLQNVWSGWPVYEVKWLCSRVQE